MSLPEELAGFSREELIELVGRLFGHIQVLEARIAELEGQQKPPTDVKERKPPSWVKANRPARPKGERRKRPPRLGARRSCDEPTHRVEHATASCPDVTCSELRGRAGLGLAMPGPTLWARQVPKPFPPAIRQGASWAMIGAAALERVPPAELCG